MALDKYKLLEDNVNFRNKLLCLGLSSIGPRGPKGDKGEKGDKGDKGDTGEVVVSSNESIFFTSYDDSNTSGVMTLKDSWLIPNPSEYFLISNDTEVEVTKGIYEISLSGIVKGVDNTHAGQFYLITKEGSAIHDLTFELTTGSINQMYFSKNILFRFEEDTILEVMAGVSGDINTSNVEIDNVTLLMKKIHE